MSQYRQQLLRKPIHHLFPTPTTEKKVRLLAKAQAWGQQRSQGWVGGEEGVSNGGGGVSSITH